MDIENQDKALYACKKGPRGSRQTISQAQAVDGEYLIKKEMEFQEKGQKAEEMRSEDCKGQSKAHTESVVGKGEGKAAVVAGESSKSAKQKGKEALYDLLHPAFSHTSAIYIEARCDISEARGF